MCIHGKTLRWFSSIFPEGVLCCAIVLPFCVETSVQTHPKALKWTSLGFVAIVIILHSTENRLLKVETLKARTKDAAKILSDLLIGVLD